MSTMFVYGFGGGAIIYWDCFELGGALLFLSL